MGSLIARIAFFFGFRKEVTVSNIRKAFPNMQSHLVDNIARDSYVNLGQVFGEMLYLRFASRNNIIKKLYIQNPELSNNLLVEGKDIIAVSGHFSNWEWMAMGGAPQLGGGFYIVVKNVVSKFSERFLQKMRIRTGNILIGAGDVRGMFKVLKEGRAVALLGDQAAPSGSVRVPFFGVDTPTFEGPARLALRTRAAMAFGVCHPDGNGNYILEFTEIPYDDLADQSDESVNELTARHVRVLEEYIRKYPSLWLWQHRRWKNA